MEKAVINEVKEAIKIIDTRELESIIERYESFIKIIKDEESKNEVKDLLKFSKSILLEKLKKEKKISSLIFKNNQKKLHDLRIMVGDLEEKQQTFILESSVIDRKILELS